MANVSHKAILQVLEEKNRWMTFDELLDNMPREYCCVTFQAHLERMVEQGQLLYIPANGMRRAYYGRIGLEW